MDLKLPEAMRELDSITIGGESVAIGEDGLITVTREQYAEIAYLEPEVIGYTADESAALTAPPEPEAPPAEPDHTTDPTVEPGPGTVYVTKTHENGSTSSLIVRRSQLEDFTTTGWVEDTSRSAPDENPEGAHEAGSQQSEDPDATGDVTPPSGQQDDDTPVDDGLEALDDAALLALAETEEVDIEDTETRGDVIDAIRDARTAKAEA